MMDPSSEQCSPSIKEAQHTGRQEECFLEGKSHDVPVNGTEYPSFKVILPTILCLYLVVFLTALDRTIVGVAITGIGAAGTAVGAITNIGDLVPLQKRPKYQGFVGAMFGLASIMGPLVGGAFTSRITWRWCFWFSVPIGGLSLVGIVFVLPLSRPPQKLEGNLIEIVRKFDPLGNALLAPGLVCLLLALQWGGTKYTWNDDRVIALLAVGSVLVISFAVVQYWVQENGTVPPRIFCQRSIASGTIVTLGLGAPLIISAFYLPIWFQAIKGTSAGSAGVRLLPYFLSTVTFVITSGIAISKLGHYTPFLIMGCACLIIGTALLSTLRVDASTGQLIGYEILVGAGIGLSLQQCYNAAQTVLAREDLPTGVAILAFSQAFGGSVFLSVCQTVLSNKLKSQLASAFPGLDTAAISATGATDIRNLVPVEKLGIVVAAYNAAIDNVFYCALAAASLAFVASLTVEWKSVRQVSNPDMSA